MRRIVCLVVLLWNVQAQAAQSSCDDDLAHALNVGVPRTSLTEESAKTLSQTLAKLVAPIYVDPCSKGKSLQINLAFGSDYEVLDWLERGIVDGGIVSDLSLWLLHQDENPVRVLNVARAAQDEILYPRAPKPVCKSYVSGRWVECAADATYDALLADLAAGKNAGSRRVLFASHLSSTGFLDPIKKAFTAFSDDEALWEKLFEIVRFTIDTDPKVDPFALALQEEADPLADLTVIVFPGDEVLARDPTSAAPNAYREHFVVSSSSSALFSSVAFASLADGKQSILPLNLERMLAMQHPPRPLESIGRGDPDLDVRSYAFTILESVRLLAQQQRSSGQSDLALVLPGGGVKAAYQSRIVDYLYGKGYVRNAGLPPKDSSLEVHSVLGTSGGALLGYFVAQLGETGPFVLSSILWRPYGKTLRPDDVFAVTDMPRYVGLVWTFMIFCVVLALVTGSYSSHFYRRSVTPHGARRWWLMTLLVMLIAVPILIRNVSGAADLERVPVVEAIFYAILMSLVMFCDQCLVYSPSEVTEARPGGLLVVVPGILGGVFVVASVVGMQALQEPVSIGFAFATMSIIFLGSPLLVLYVSGRLGDGRRRLFDTVVSLVGVIILCAFGVPGMIPTSMRYLFAFDVLIGVAVCAYWHVHQPKRNKLVISAMTFLTLFATAVLCWSETPVFGRPGLQFMNAPAMETTLAPFLVLTGCLLLVIAVLGWVYQRPDYSLRNGEDFSVSVAVLLGYATITSAVVTIISIVLPGLVHGAEMTLSFWTALTLIGGVLAAIVIFAAPRWPVLRRAVGFLTSEHPNGSLLPRRYARMLALTTLSLIWWNTMVAPALYGNDTARKYLKQAVVQFDREFRRAAGDNPFSGMARGFIPTANFVVPTNTLDGQNATRYFLFLTENSRSIYLPRRMADAEWRMYSTTSKYPPQSDCRKVITPQCVEFVQEVIFSSGSPFPIFPVHRVKLPGETQSLSLIDGGYSNNIAIDAARTIAAQQVLVVHSSPVTEVHEHDPIRFSFTRVLPGMLVRNVTRLPGFIFERGQQVDRVSRQNLFVVSLSPKLGPGESWPSLAQFDTLTVEALLDKATTNINERIGLVESWGTPRFRFSQQVPAPTAPPATKKDPASPRRAQPGAR